MPNRIVAGTRLHYAFSPAAGNERPPLLLIHGAGGDHTVWGAQAAGLRGQVQLVLPDLPGHGQSGPGDENTIPAFACVIREFAAGLGLPRPIVGGHSMGGAVALQAALDAPEAFRGVALIASGARLGVAERVFESLARDPEGAVREIARTAYGPQAPEEMIERGVETLSRASRETLEADFRACNAFDVRDRLGELRVPLRILCGGADRLTLPRFAEKLAEAVAGSKLLLVPGAGHLLMIERPDEVNAELTAFADEVANPGSA